MKRGVLIAFFFAVLLCLVPVFADETIDAAQDVIEKIRKEREEDKAKREEEKAKAAAGKNISIPGKLVFYGKIEKISFNLGSTTAGSLALVLSSGQKITTPYSANFIMRKQTVTLTNLRMGMKVAIVNPPPVISVPLPGQKPMDPVAADKLLTTCVISSASKIYCGNDAENLSVYYPPPAPPKPAAPKKKY